MSGMGLWSLLLGCLANEVVVTTKTPVDSNPPSDSAPPQETVDSAPPEPILAPDFARWQGTLRFVGDTWAGSCDDTVQEVGSLLPKGHATYSACAACDVIFSLEPTPAQGCVVGGGASLPLSSPTLRGLDLGSDWASVYALEDEEGRLVARLLDSGASLTDGTVRFAYSASLLGALVDITGEVTFPLVASR